MKLAELHPTQYGLSRARSAAMRNTLAVIEAGGTLFPRR
jgi:hypothetical protein